MSLYGNTSLIISNSSENEIMIIEESRYQTSVTVYEKGFNKVRCH